jgi:hypothetical protein
MIGKIIEDGMMQFIVTTDKSIVSGSTKSDSSWQNNLDKSVKVYNTCS